MYLYVPTTNTCVIKQTYHYIDIPFSLDLYQRNSVFSQLILLPYSHSEVYCYHNYTIYIYVYCIYIVDNSKIKQSYHTLSYYYIKPELKPQHSSHIQYLVTYQYIFKISI